MKHVNEKWLDIASLEDIPRRGGRVSDFSTSRNTAR